MSHPYRPLARTQPSELGERLGRLAAFAGQPVYTGAMVQSAVDLLVLAPDRPDVALVAEVKARDVADPAAVEEQLKRYMLDRRCPVGLLVTPRSTWIYRDSYRDYSQASVERVAELRTSDLFASPAMVGLELERQLFDWLERLAASWPAALPAADPARAVVVEHLVPAVVEGRVVLHSAAA